MRFEQNAALSRRFTTSVLPWLIGLVALVVYLATMNTSATFSSANVVARASGWAWQPEIYQPLSYLFFIPFRFLPEATVPFAINAFNALLAALVIGLIARSVSLLPHDRTADQRDNERDDHAIFSGRFAWVPPTLAAIALGLQISFWENATAATGEIINALVVVYVIRCLLEFRLDERQSWLSRAAFVYAAGATNNWALIGLAPVFLAAIIWIKGLSFFNLGFLGRMAAWFIAGLLLYLLLPLVQSNASLAPVPFMAALKANLSSQWVTLKQVYYFYKDNYRIVVIAATSLLPLFFIALRWSSSFGDNSPLGIFVTKAVLHFVHALFFGVCLLVVFSPPFSPRQLIAGVPFLTHAVFGAVVIGYCAGYFLLVCSPAFKPRSRINPILKFAGYLGAGAVALALVITPVALVARNLEPIRATNKRLVEDFTKRIERTLPAGRCTIASDNPAQLTILRIQLAKQGRKDCIFYDTQSAPFADYHTLEHRRNPQLWPALFATLTNHPQINPAGLVMFLGVVSTNMPIYYLQPSFGYYFERFKLAPHGPIYTIAPYGTNSLFDTKLPESALKLASEYWEDFDASTLPYLKSLIPSEEKRPMPAWKKTLMSRLHLSAERVLTAEILANYYSRAATHWGGQLQQHGQWEAAAKSFERARALNPDNVVAEINLEFNTARRKNETPPADFSASVEDRFGKYRNWTDVISDCGPFDEPRFTFEQARVFLRNRPNPLYLQATHQMQRVTELEPRNLIAHIWLADLYSMLGRPENAMDIVRDVRKNSEQFGVNATNALELTRIEVATLFRKGEKDDAKTLLAKALKKPEAGSQFRFVASQLYLQNGLNAEAVPLLDQAIAEKPDDLMALANRGYALLQLERYDEARESLTRALDLDPKNSVARLNRAIVNLRTKQYAAALDDYDILLEQFPNAYQVRFGLGEIEAGKGNTNAAIEHFKSCLPLVPPGSPDYLQVSNRLEELKAPKP